MSETGQFNKCVIKDIVVKDVLLDWDVIKTNGYDKGVNNRPVRPAHVSKLVASPQDKSFDTKPIVMYDSTDNTYAILDGQHSHSALEELIDKNERSQPESFICSVAYRKSNQKLMDVTDKADAAIAIKHGYGRNSGNEGVAYCDAMYIVQIEMKRIKEELDIGETPTIPELKNMYIELEKVEFGYRKYSTSSLKDFYNLGNKLVKAGVLKEAQVNRWKFRQVLYFVKTGNKPDPKERDKLGDKIEKAPLTLLDEEDFPENREVVIVAFKDDMFRKAVIDKITEMSPKMLEIFNKK